MVLSTAWDLKNHEQQKNCKSESHCELISDGDQKWYLQFKTFCFKIQKNKTDFQKKSRAIEDLPIYLI